MTRRSVARMFALLCLALSLAMPAAALAASGGGWTTLGSGPDNNVFALEKVGNKLYVGGRFDSAGGVTGTARLAVWDGSSWSRVGAGLVGTVYAIAVHQPSGKVFVAGGFPSAGGNTNAVNIAMWDGAHWQPVGGGGDIGLINALEVVGNWLYVGCSCHDIGGITWSDYIARINVNSPDAWHPITDNNMDIPGPVFDLEADGQGGVFLGGNFANAFGENTMDYVLRYANGGFAALGSSSPGVDEGALNGTVRGLARAGNDLYAVGTFSHAGTAAHTSSIARWDGAAWHAVGNPPFPIGQAQRLVDVITDGPRVFVVGEFQDAGNRPKLDGVSAFVNGDWVNVGTNEAGNNGPAANLQDVALIGSRLYVGGIGRIGGQNVFSAAFYRVRQPDALIKTTGSFVGNNVYNLSGASQARSRTLRRGTTGTFLLQIGNDGIAADSFTLKGPGTGNGFTVKYLAGATNITAAVVAGTYAINNIAPKGSRTITLEVKPAAGVNDGARRSFLVVATSTGAGSPKDAVKATVTAS